MRDTPKVVFSHTLESADWQNTTLTKTDAIEAIKKLKSTTDKDIAILGGSEFCSSIIPSGIIDEYRLMINPIVIGYGTPLFHGIRQLLSVSLLNTRTFANDNVLAYYQSK
jgi:dihydrofolate reductase